jgi:branched-chain amino acid transport system ATP-binding protein
MSGQLLPADARRAASAAEPVLEVRDATVAYRGVRALDGVSVKAVPAEVLGIIGPNGAGKSTLVNLIAGVTSGGGEVLLDSVPLRSGAPFRRARAGIGRTFQTPQLFRTLSAAENIEVAARAGAHSGRGRSRPDQIRRRVADALDAVGLGARAAIRAESLSAGECKLLELARALVTKPRVLILDEPAAGTQEKDRARMIETVREYVSDLRHTCILIEHDMELISKASDWLYVLAEGRLIQEGTWNHIRQDEHVRTAYLGTA